MLEPIFLNTLFRLLCTFIQLFRLNFLKKINLKKIFKKKDSEKTWWKNFLCLDGAFKKLLCVSFFFKKFKTTQQFLKKIFENNKNTTMFFKKTNLFLFFLFFCILK